MEKNKKRKKIVLGIDVTNDLSSIAVWDNCILWRGDRQQSKDLLLKIENILNKSKIDFRDLDGIVVVNGPGSYTGIRIGMSVANTLAMVLGVPVKSVDGLRIQAELLNSKIRETGARVFSVISAGGTRIYGRKYIWQNTQVEPTGDFYVGEIGDFLVDCKTKDYIVGEVNEEVDKIITMMGKSKVKGQRSKIKEDINNILLLDEKNNIGRALAGVRLFDDLPVLKNNIALPLYLRGAVASK